MNLPETMNVIAGLLQFIVAGYALRLNRRFGIARVGWSLFWAFALLALLHLVQSFASYRAGEPLGLEINIMYSLISLLLLVGMLHLEALLKERLRVEQEELRMRNELESQVQKKTAYLTRAIEELQAEMDERKRLESQFQKTNQKLLNASRQPEMAEIADCILHNAETMLKSIQISSGLVSDPAGESAIAGLVRIGQRVREHAADLGRYLEHDSQGRKLPQDIAQLAGRLTGEQAELAHELESLKQHLEQILAIHRNYANLVQESELAVKF